MTGLASPGAVAVVIATGAATQMGDDTEVTLALAGRSMVSWTLGTLTRVPEVVRTLLVTRADDLDDAQALANEFPALDVDVIAGDDSWSRSERKALECLAKDIQSGAIEIVLVHDAGRPLCRPELMQAVISAARRVGGAVPVLEIPALFMRSPQGTIAPQDQARRYVRVQTPQAFRALPLLRACEAAEQVGFEGEDTHASVERFSDVDVTVIPGSELNVRVASADDFIVAERLLAAGLP